ncbi:MAG TPA: TrmH family RNA methyltransferase [Candidatus Sulfotelmatobacter sp.]|nr:TrmH family RNA methyltransferase [Candidatus Sulfotelmatobacter sp.]
MKLDAKRLRLSEYDSEVFKKIKRNPVYIIVDNVLDTYNIGSIFRLADAIAGEKIYLCGGTEIPPHHRIKKASINTTEWVPWEYKKTAFDAIKDLRSKVPGIQIVSIEQNDKSVQYNTIPYSFPVALIVGHETDGVSKEAMDASDYIAEMPMWGINISLNVMVSLGIMLYKVMEFYK